MIVHHNAGCIVCIATLAERTHGAWPAMGNALHRTWPTHRAHICPVPARRTPDSSDQLFKYPARVRPIAVESWRRNLHADPASRLPAAHSRRVRCVVALVLEVARETVCAIAAAGPKANALVQEDVVQKHARPGSAGFLVLGFEALVRADEGSEVRRAGKPLLERSNEDVLVLANFVEVERICFGRSAGALNQTAASDPGAAYQITADHVTPLDAVHRLGVPKRPLRGVLDDAAALQRAQKARAGSKVFIREARRRLTPRDLPSLVAGGADAPALGHDLGQENAHRFLGDLFRPRRPPPRHGAAARPPAPRRAARRSNKTAERGRARRAVM